MEPSRQESISRQSSILKAPKQRQPLQCVATNPSSSESSPTIKLKRRVSFAKNKRIREFCNEVEPKEGLDDSYEEHDLSNTKSSSGNSTDHPLVISVACEDKENFPIQLFIPTDQVQCKELQAAPLCIEDNNLSQCEMEMDSSVDNFQQVNTEVENKDATIYFDDGMDITSSIQPQIISTHVQEDIYCNDTVPVSQTSNEDAPMEMTENLASLLSKKLAHIQNTNQNVYSEHNFSNLTEPASTILGIGHNKQSMEFQSTKLIPRTFENETECFTDAPLEFTSVIPSSTWIRPHNQSQDNDETERLNGKTMEFTEVVQLHNILCKNKTKGMDDATKENILCDNLSIVVEANPNRNSINQMSNGNQILLEKVQEKTTIFPNVSMEMTEAVPAYGATKTMPLSMKVIPQEVVQEKTKIFCDQSMELTGVPTNVFHHLKSSKQELVQRQEKTKIFIDTSMEMTEAIANRNRIGMKNCVPKTDANKTKVFCNTSMEMTEAVPVCPQIQTVEKTHPSVMPDKTTLFNNHSMEMTEAIVNQNKIGMTNCLPKTNANRTKVFCNTSMEMTEAVPVCSQIQTVGKPHPSVIPDKTALFNNHSMEMTEALGFNKSKHSNHRKSQLVAPINEKTQHLVNASMEMTEAVPTNNKVKESILTGNKTGHEITQDRTKFFHDKSMEVTEAVIHHSRIPRLSKLDNQMLDSRQEKTKLFSNASMEMTEAVPTSNKVKEPAPTVYKIGHDFTQEKTKLFNDKSMEITEAVIQNNKCPPLNKFNNQIVEPRQEKTKLFFNTSMEMTEAVPTLLSKIYQPTVDVEKIHEDASLQKTEVFCNKSMEMTEAVPTILSRINQPTVDVGKIHEDATLQKTEFFCNRSMEMTEAVPVYHHINKYTSGKERKQDITEDRTKIYQNKSIEVTETVVNHKKTDFHGNSVNQRLDPGQEQTKFFCNTSMEMTEAAPVINRSHRLAPEIEDVSCRNIPEQTEIFQNKSMEMTEAIRNYRSNNYHLENSEIGERVQEKTRVFPNMSATETIPVNKDMWQNHRDSRVLIFKKSQEISIDSRRVGQSNENLNNEAINSENKDTSTVRDEGTKYFSKSMDITENLPVSEHQNEVANLMTDKTKHFFNNSMDITDAIMKNQNLFSANPPILSNSMKDSERLQQYESILPSKIDIENPNLMNNRRDNDFNVSCYGDKSFHRMTTDELNTLCASMNLPTQNYTAERSSAVQNDFISICNDVNVLRDSLQKNTIFQQNYTLGSGNMQISSDVSEQSKKQDNFQVFCDENYDPTEKNASSREGISEIMLTGIESQKEYSSAHTNVSKERSNDIPEPKLTESNTRSSPDPNVFEYLKNPININDAEYLNCNTSVSEPPQIQSASANLSSIKKTCTKRKSWEMDDNAANTDNSLKRLPSDNTDLLIATMGFKTELPHPLIINDKTTIKIPRAPSMSDPHSLTSCSNATIQREESISNDREKSSKNLATSMRENEAFDEECNSSNKENHSLTDIEQIVRTENFLENSMDKLDEIQPPSFLCLDSLQNSIVDEEMLADKVGDEIMEEQVDVSLEQECCRENSILSSSNHSSRREMRQSFEKDFSPRSSMDGINSAKIHKESNESVHKIAIFNNSRNFNESVISLINEENVNTDPLAPFLSLTNSIETFAKRDDCIWTIRKIDQKTVAVDFISKSFVTIIRLNEIEKACIKDIDNIEFISRVHCNSKNILLKIVHRLLLSKLKPDKLLSEYKMYEDVLPLLNYVSNEVILAMNFMFDIERLSALNLLKVDSERVLFMVSSKKANIILEISLMLKVFSEIGPDDICVTCVLGDVRINDIKQLIVNIRRDSTFLSRYIDDVKDYIALMEESTHMQR